ncbi:hypothetical protein ATW62_09520 [Oenococcus oeni]|nr:hypothetical protein ATW62_09520 [Oenococcus oeni]OIM65462.1 hypothetical protein ATX88_09335 [Oenococcus oeni]
MPFFVIKKGLVLLEWKYFPTPKILDPLLLDRWKEITLYLVPFFQKLVYNTYVSVIKWGLN